MSQETGLAVEVVAGEVMPRSCYPVNESLASDLAAKMAVMIDRERIERCPTPPDWMESAKALPTLLVECPLRQKSEAIAKAKRYEAERTPTVRSLVADYAPWSIRLARQVTGRASSH